MSAQVQRYEDFIAAKNVAAPCRGFEPPLPLHAGLFPFQRDAVGWAVRKETGGGIAFGSAPVRQVSFGYVTNQGQQTYFTEIGRKAPGFRHGDG